MQQASIAHRISTETAVSFVRGFGLVHYEQVIPAGDPVHRFQLDCQEVMLTHAAVLLAQCEITVLHVAVV